MQLRFCPACGNKLPETGKIRFCPACGEKLEPVFAAAAAGEPSMTGDAAPVGSKPGETPASPAEMLRCHETVLTNCQKAERDKDEIHQQTQPLFDRVKEQPDHSRLTRTLLPAEPVRQPEPAHGADYSVVLKTNGNKEQVARRLSQVLRRSLTATRMAVELVPCILLYKSKAGDIEAVRRILEEENLHYVVIKGEVAAGSPEQIIPKFTRLAAQVQQRLRQCPAALWLGEEIRTVVCDSSLEDSLGLLVLTDQGLYFFPDAPAGQWLTIPFSQLSEVVLHKEPDSELELVYKAYNREEWLHISNTEQLEQVYEQIRQGMQC